LRTVRLAVQFSWKPPFALICSYPGVRCARHSDGQITAGSTVADLAKLDFARVNPVVGPVYIDGAEPNDAVKVTLLSFAPSGWGWTANIPGFGLLADQFPEPALYIWKYDAVSLAPAIYGPGGRVPLKPFCGTIGLAPAEPGVHDIVPPRRIGGNMDIRDISAGTELYLPVEVRGHSSRSVIPMRRRAMARSAERRLRERGGCGRGGCRP